MNQPGLSGTQSSADVQAAFCAVLVDEWARAGVTDAVVAPGSRSTPLVVALDADPRISVHVVLDERSAGFTALGIGLGTGRPAAVVTTSGTAAVELHPAVVEAHQAGVPLVAATADRPPELHHVGAPQTVHQEDLFGPSVRWAASLAVADLAAVSSWRSVSSRVVAEATCGPLGPGPVHVNVAFREPLLGDASAIEVPAGRPGGAPWHSASRGESAVAPEELVDLLASHSGGRGLVIAGAGCGDPDQLLQSAGALGWPVLADPRSGCRTGGGVSIASADPLLRVPSVAAGWIPDVVVRAGAPWASKVLSQWIASLPADVPQVLCDRWGRWMDPERAASAVVRLDGSALLGRVASRATNTADASGWLSRWLDAEVSAQQVLDETLLAGGRFELSEPAVARAVTGSSPPGTRVVVSSSMPIRDVEWFGRAVQSAEILSNRGANGIDGVLSTAVGVAVSDSRPVVALLGDLAFLYDAGALLGAASRDLSLTIVVVDNGGGGIFSFLPQATSMPADRFERYWGTPHGVDIAAVAAAYGAGTSVVQSRADLDRVLSSAGKPGVSVVLVRSDRRANVDVHEHLNAAVASAVA